ncbi:MAG: outer membrane beta-barrel protein [Nitrospirae bacterium]|nr:outer membrane beta-barrel protein [Nitrospirota bacterium]
MIGVILGFIPALGSVPSAWAVGNLYLGPVELHPFFQVSESLDDNVCRTEAKLCQDPQDSTKTKKGRDQITVFSPGLQIALPFQDHRLQAEYRGDFGRYNEFKTENYSDNTLKGDLAFNFRGGLSALLKDDWKAGHDPRGFSQNVDLDFYHRNTAGAELGFQAGTKLRLVLNGSSMVLNYADDARNGFRDRTDNTLGGTVYYKFLPKTSALVEYDYTAVRFDEADPAFGNQKLDSKVQRAYLGLTWNITTRSQGTLKGGYTRKNFSASGLDDFKGGIVSLSLAHDLSARTSVRLDGERDVRESNIALQPYYLSAGGRLELVHLIRPRIAAKLKGGLSRDQYPGTMTIGAQTKKRVDDTWNAGAGLEYHPRDWLNLGLQYDHSQRRSDLDGLGYIDNLYVFSLGVVF